MTIESYSELFPIVEITPFKPTLIYTHIAKLHRPE